MTTPLPSPDAQLAEHVVERLLSTGLVPPEQAAGVRAAVASGQTSKADWRDWVALDSTPAAMGDAPPWPEQTAYG